MKRALWILFACAVLAAGVLLLAVLCGSSGCAGFATIQPDLLWQLRLPRALLAFAVGGLLALAGALMQLLLRNPLADPYVLGVSSGAATGAMIAILLAPAAAGLWGTHLGAFTGALLALGLLFGLTRNSGNTNPSNNASLRLILIGVMIAAGFGACMTLLLSLAPDAHLRGMIFWLMGDLENNLLYGPACLVLVLSVMWASRHAAQLNVLAHGDRAAQLLGLPVARLRTHTLLIASAMTASAVAVAGTIGFVGLVAPHALRLMLGNDQRLLLPASALGGGIVLMLSDLLARTVVAPVQLPVGVVTALIGVPVFLFLLGRTRT